jgi:hypothetical protein
MRRQYYENPRERFLRIELWIIQDFDFTSMESEFRRKLIRFSFWSVRLLKTYCIIYKQLKSKIVPYLYFGRDSKLFYC